MGEARVASRSGSRCGAEAVADARIFRFLLIGAAPFLSPQRKIEGIVKYLLAHYEGVLHVRRVVSWLGLVVLGVEKVVGSCWFPSSGRRCAYFRYRGRTYKAKFDHHVARGGGIVIIELAGKSTRSPARATVAKIRNLREAESFYLDPFSHLSAESG